MQNVEIYRRWKDHGRHTVSVSHASQGVHRFTAHIFLTSHGSLIVRFCIIHFSSDFLEYNATDSEEILDVTTSKQLLITHQVDFSVSWNCYFSYAGDSSENESSRYLSFGSNTDAAAGQGDDVINSSSEDV